MNIIVSRTLKDKPCTSLTVLQLLLISLNNGHLRRCLFVHSPPSYRAVAFHTCAPHLLACPFREPLTLDSSLFWHVAFPRQELFGCDEDVVWIDVLGSIGLCIGNFDLRHLIQVFLTDPALRTALGSDLYQVIRDAGRLRLLLQTN